MFAGKLFQSRLLFARQVAGVPESQIFILSGQGLLQANQIVEPGQGVTSVANWESVANHLATLKVKQVMVLAGKAQREELRKRTPPYVRWIEPVPSSMGAVAQINWLARATQAPPHKMLEYLLVHERSGIDAGMVECFGSKLGKWGEVYSTLSRLRAGADASGKARYVMLHPAIVMENMPAIPFQLMTHEGNRFVVHIEPCANRRLQAAIKQQGLYRAFAEMPDFTVRYHVRVKRMRYWVDITWHLDSELCCSIDVSKEGGKRCNRVRLGARMYALVGFLEGMAEWVARSHHRLPGWDKPHLGHPLDLIGEGNRQISLWEYGLPTVSTKRRRPQPPKWQAMAVS